MGGSSVVGHPQELLDLYLVERGHAPVLPPVDDKEEVLVRDRSHHIRQLVLPPPLPAQLGELPADQLEVVPFAAAPLREPPPGVPIGGELPLDRPAPAEQA